MRLITLKQRKELSNEDIANIVITAFEGGISYWCDRAEAVKHKELDLVAPGASGWVRILGDEYNDLLTEDRCSPYANPYFWAVDHYGYRLHDQFEEADVPLVLRASRIAMVLQKLADSDDLWDQNRAARLLEPGRYDADDADYLIQMSVFDEVVYG